MTIAEKHGLAFFPIPGGVSNPMVLAFAHAHYRAIGLPESTVPAGRHWFAVGEKDGSEVYAIFGWRLLRELDIIDFTDFYARRSRRGVIAMHAIFERIRTDSDRSGNSVMGAVPGWHLRMLNAVRRAFGFTGNISWGEGVEPPSFVVTVYTPKEATGVVGSEQEVA